RLHPVPGAAAVRRPRPDRPAPHRGRPRPRREPVRRVHAGHAAAVGPGHAGRRGADRAADVRRLLHAGPGLGLAAHQHDRQPDRPADPAGLPEDRRRGADDHPGARAAGADAVLPAHHAASRSGDGALMAWFRNPWGRPRFLPIIVVAYIVWTILPVVIAILFAFNDG